MSQRVKIFYVYMGLTHNGNHRYFRLNEISENDGESFRDFKDFEDRDLVYETNLFTKGDVGSIFELERVEEDKSVFYNKKAFPVGIWRNNSDRRRWELEDKANYLLIQPLKDIKKKELDELLKPIADMIRSSTRAEKSKMISVIVDKLFKI